jgi:hypothetical protein
MCCQLSNTIIKCGTLVSAEQPDSKQRETEKKTLTPNIGGLQNAIMNPTDGKRLLLLVIQIVHDRIMQLI